MRDVLGATPALWENVPLPAFLNTIRYVGFGGSANVIFKLDRALTF